MMNDIEIADAIEAIREEHLRAGRMLPNRTNRKTKRPLHLRVHDRRRKNRAANAMRRISRRHRK